MTAPICNLQVDREAALRTAVALLGLPVELDVDGVTGTVIVRMPHDLNTSAEVRVLRVVESYTGDFRRQAV
jgi:hypothetical protein